MFELFQADMSIMKTHRTLLTSLIQVSSKVFTKFIRTPFILEEACEVY